MREENLMICYHSEFAGPRISDPRETTAVVRRKIALDATLCCLLRAHEALANVSGQFFSEKMHTALTILGEELDRVGTLKVE